MSKKTTKKKLTRINILLVIIIILLIALNIFTFQKYLTKNNDECQLCLTETKIDSKYNPDKKYYTEVKFNDFKKLYTGKQIAIIAITDNSSLTHDKFVEYVNKKAYYDKININLIELSKLSKKNEIAFFELNEKLSKLDSDYIIYVKENKILLTIELSKEDLNSLVELYQ